MTVSAQVAVLGLGNLGTALADALLRSGRSVVVWNRTAARAEPLVSRGAVLAASAAEAIRAAPVAIMCLLDYQAAAEVLGAAGVAEGIAGRTLVQLSSGLPEEAVEQAAWAHRHGGRFISGGVMVFANDIGKPDASIVYAGDEDAFQAHRDVLVALGGASQYLGSDPRSSIAIYLAAGLYMMGSLAMFLETAAIAESLGVPITTFRDHALGTSGILQDRIRDSAARIDQGRFDGDEATIDMLVPSLEQHCERFARAGLEARLTAAFVQHLHAAAAAGRGQCDIAALLRG